ncbi:DUF4867 family protein [Caproicibacter sp.]|uniref:DUF4867 family protein n=1 Tax=Caproicibacter sp. TaxID=2814884 RepID=UPI00398A3A59
MEVQSIRDDAFRKYGRVVSGFDCAPLLSRLKKTPCPSDTTVYVASDPELEKLDVFGELQDREFGGLPIELGYCNGSNDKLNALEYHRSSEINIAGTDLILLLGLLQDVSAAFTYDTGRVEAFRVPAGTAVELYATTLHFAPCSASPEGFRDAVILPRGTNLPLEAKPAAQGEDALLFAKNKWLIAHPESGLQADGAFVGLQGKNIRV